MDGRQLLRTSTLVCSVCQLQMGWELLLVCPAVVLFSIRCSCRFNLKIWCRLTTQYWWSPRTTVERRDGRRRQVDSSCADGRYQAWSGSWSPSHCKSEGWYYCWAVLNVLGACHDTHRAGHGESEIVDWHDVGEDLRHLESSCKAKIDQAWGLCFFYTLDELDI